MSHTVQCTVKMTDVAVIKQAAKNLQVEYLGQVTDHRMYDGTKVAGHKVQLRGWNHPIVIDSEGNTHYDNYGGSWGDQLELDKFAQEYGLLSLEDEAIAQGRSFQRIAAGNGIDEYGNVTQEGDIILEIDC